MKVILLASLTAAAAAMFYLTLANQRWLSAPLAGRWRSLAQAVLLLLLVAWVWLMEPLAAVLSWLVVLMLVVGLLPALTLLKAVPQQTAPRRQRGEQG
ncbi:hypothetical protein [Oceanobacter mangrovi]|uniref:hypothetical protein n=1 Tax=Oceanobacter mangrovi TaxID=2862510 RepID=UPI001C8F1977|nr:hypothetical protein [Oceanobacter mangrovi]